MFNLKEGKISSYGLFHLLVILGISNLFLGVPRAMVMEGDSAGWLLMLLAGIVASLGLYINIKLFKKFPGKDILDISETLWGRPGAVGLSLIIAAVALFTATVTLREFAETMLTTVLPRTPISVISFFFVAAILYGSYKGLEVITRSTVLMFPFIIGGIFSILFLTGNFINLNNLFPMLGSGIDKLLYHAPGRSSVFVEILIAGLIVSKLTDPEKAPGQIWKAFVFILVTYVIVELFYISVLRVTAAKNLYVPLFQLAKIIYMGRFVQRIEAIYIFVWFFTGALKLTISVYVGATALSKGFRIPIYQPFLFPLCLLIFALSFIPKDMNSATSLDMEFLREYSGIAAWGLPLIMLISSFIQKKGGGQTEKNKTGS